MSTVTTPVSSGQTPGSNPAPPVFPLAGSFPWAGSARGKPRRGMMRRAVFSDLQRKGLERRFQMQKYISKPDRKKLAEKLGLKDSQVRNIVGKYINPHHRSNGIKHLLSQMVLREKSNSNGNRVKNK
jgi:hypothetical protein